MHDCSVYIVAGPPGQPSQPPPPPPTPPPSHRQHQLVTDRLLATLDREETKFDVQIGDGMDIEIAGENGKIREF